MPTLLPFLSRICSSFLITWVKP